MNKGSSNYKSRKSRNSKPYDVSQSFVSKVASSVSALLPQRLSRWISSDETVSNQIDTNSHVQLSSSTPLVSTYNLYNASPENHAAGSKRPRLPFDSPVMAKRGRFMSNTSVQEEISPIVPSNVHQASNDSDVAGPSGLCKFNQNNQNLTPVSTSAGGSTHAKLKEKLMGSPVIQSETSNNDKLNGGDDCSETSESTSGCSSLVPQAQSSQSRHSQARQLNFTGNLSSSRLDRSLFPGRCRPRQEALSLSRRRPGFDSSAFLSSSRLVNLSSNPNQTVSPFYNGRTMYGGASACNKSALFSPTPRRSFEVIRPVNAKQGDLPISTTAKKILDALEQFSTPAVTPKKQPLTPSTAKRTKLERYPELSVPTSMELLRNKRRERLQLSTSTARKASQSSASQSKAPENTTSVEYSIRSNNGGEKHTSKLMRKDKEIEDEPPVLVNLPQAILPVKSLPKFDIQVPPRPKLPETEKSKSVVSAATTSFSFTGSSVNVTDKIATMPSAFSGGDSMSKFGLSSSSTFSTSRSATISSDSKIDTEFKFSNPISVKVDTLRTNSSTESNNFIFSEPIKYDTIKKTESFSLTTNNYKDNKTDSLFSFVNDKSVKNSEFSKLQNDLNSSPKSLNSNATEIGNDSALKVSTSPTNNEKQANALGNNVWKCPMCMLSNDKGNVNCSACDTKKNNPASIVTSTSPLVFKPPVDTWECKECFIRNKNISSKCAACDAPKNIKPVVSSSSTAAPTVTTIVTLSSSSSGSTSSVSSTTFQGFGDKFKPPSDTWECKECFVRNKNSIDKCVSCGSVKPGASSTAQPVKPTTSGFGNLFKKPEGSWECGTCMVRNDSKSIKCVSCETPKPGSENEVKAVSSSSITSSGYSFGIPKTSTTGTGFKLPSSTGSSLLNNEEKKQTSGGFQFGVPTTSSGTKVNFTFGIPQTKPTVNNTDSSDKNEKKDEITFKMPEKQTTTQNIFKFGADNSRNNKKEENDSMNSSINKPLIESTGSSNSNTDVKITDNPFKQITETSTNVFLFGSSASINKTEVENKSNNLVFQPKFDSNSETAKAGTSTLAGSFNNVANEDKKTNTKLDLFGFESSKPPQNANDTLFTANSLPTKAFPEINPFNNVKTDIKTPIFGSNLNDSKANSLTNTNVPSFNAVASFSQTGFKQVTSTPSFLPTINSNTNTSAHFESSTNQPQEKPLFNSAAPTPSSGFTLFGGSNTNEQAKQPFTFGSTSQTTTGFSFKPPQAMTTPNFNFTPKEPEQQSSGFNFTAVNPVQISSIPEQSTFNAQNQPTMFNDPAASRNIFTFGSQSVQPQPQATMNTPVFGNAGVQGSTVTQNAFVFGSANAETNLPATPTVAFDPNVRPAFNFTGGSTPTFSANPNPGSTPGIVRRTIKKAVRKLR